MIGLFTQTISAQITDQFTDGNFTMNPPWTGDDSLYRVNTSLQLQSIGTIGGNSCMVMTGPDADTLEWNMWLRMAFNPSSQNQVRIYLRSDQRNVKGNVNAYYLQLGGSTGSTDSIALYRQNGTIHTCLFKGRPGTLGKNSNTLKLMVRQEGGLWTVYADTATKGIWIKEGQYADSVTHLEPMVGIWFRYTSGNASNLYADDVHIGPPVKDLSPPAVTLAWMPESVQVRLEFSESKLKCDRCSIHFNSISLPLNNELTSPLLLNVPAVLKDQVNSLVIQGLQDEAGNVLDTILELFYHQWQPGDLLITELMPDPDPPVGLPNAEYAEVWNPLKVPLFLGTISISDGSTTAALPPIYLPADAMLLLSAQKDSSVFSPYSIIYGLSGMPSLNNSNDRIQLKFGNLVLHDVAYDLSWYGGTAKANGGYSLELKNPLQLCKGSANWTASNDATGGTPGRKNSVWSQEPDVSPPMYTNWRIDDHSDLLLFMNEPVVKLDSISLQPHGKMTWLITDDGLTLQLHSTDSLHHGTSYQLILHGVGDCSNNEGLLSLNFSFYELRAIKQNDVIISEVHVANDNGPNSLSGVPYLELHNTTAFAKALDKMQLSDPYRSTVLPAYRLMPGAYVVICRSIDQTKFETTVPKLPVASLPDLNQTDKIRLADSSGFLVHALNYDPTWMQEGYQPFSESLEWKTGSNPCGGKASYGPSQSATGGTPGEPGSVNGTRDLTPPTLMQIGVADERNLLLYFNEPIDSLSLCKPNNFFWKEQSIKGPFRYRNNTGSELLVTLPEVMDSNQTHVLRINDMTDCAGNHQTSMETPGVSLPVTPEKGTVVLNELLFNPKPGCDDFIELYNTGDRTLKLGEVMLAAPSTDGPAALFPMGNDEVLLPGSFLALTTSMERLRQCYSECSSFNMLEISIPSMNDEGATIWLIRKDGTMIDSITFSEKWHLPFLTDRQAVSLERIDPFASGNNSNNWTSAASEVRNATPGRKNSQWNTGSGNGFFTTEQDWFSPDGDGQHDFLTFHFKTENARSMVEVMIYSLQGTLVKTQRTSLIAGAENVVRWFGDGDSGAICGIGNYFVVCKAIDALGNQKQYSLVVSLLGATHQE